MDWRVDIDYHEIDLQIGDLYLLSTDGIHSFIPDKELHAIIASRSETLDARCEELLTCAEVHHSDDNRSCQLLEIIDLPPTDAHALGLNTLAPLPPPLVKGQILDGYVIEAEIQGNARSHVYKVRDKSDNQLYILKTPSINIADDVDALRAFPFSRLTLFSQRLPVAPGMTAEATTHQYDYSAKSEVSQACWLTTPTVLNH